MRIVIHQRKYYDWEPLPEGVEPTEKDFHSLRVKQMHDGKVHMRVEKAFDTHTAIGPHDADIAEQMERGDRTRAQVVAGMVDRIIPHHGHPKHFVKIECHDEPEVEKFLNTYFDTEYNRDAAAADAWLEEVAKRNAPRAPAEEVSP